MPGLAQSVEHETLDLGIMSSSPMLSVKITLKKKRQLTNFQLQTSHGEEKYSIGNIVNNIAITK